MNSIRRRRRRPRVRSVSFRTLFWLVAFEASYMVWSAWKVGPSAPRVSREAYWLHARRQWKRSALGLVAAYHRLRILS